MILHGREKRGQVEQQKKSLAEIVSQIDEWLRTQNGSGKEDQFARILRTVVKLAGDNAGRGTPLGSSRPTVKYVR